MLKNHVNARHFATTSYAKETYFIKKTPKKHILQSLIFISYLQFDTALTMHTRTTTNINEAHEYRTASNNTSYRSIEMVVYREGRLMHKNDPR